MVTTLEDFDNWVFFKNIRDQLRSYNLNCQAKKIIQILIESLISYHVFQLLLKKYFTCWQLSAQVLLYIGNCCRLQEVGWGLLPVTHFPNLHLINFVPWLWFFFKFKIKHDLHKCLVDLLCLKLVELWQTSIKCSSSPVFRGVDCKFHSTVFTGFCCRLTYRYLTHQGL